MEWVGIRTEVMGKSECSVRMLIGGIGNGIRIDGSGKGMGTKKSFPHTSSARWLC